MIRPWKVVLSVALGAALLPSSAMAQAAGPDHLTNGAFTMPQPFSVAFSKSSWTAPVSNDNVTITFTQLIKDKDPLRTGTYSKALTFTLSTTTP